MRNITLALAMMVTSGCVHNIDIQAVKPWENHYMTVEQFKVGTQDITLEDDETIWVMSNTTLKRVLKNIDRK